jgi:hypothetical protein
MGEEYIVLKEKRWNVFILSRLIKVKTILYVKTDVKGRRHGYRIGLDTLIVHAENDECHKVANKLVIAIL